MKQLVISFFMVGLSITANARQENTGTQKWAVPNITYTCTARLLQDWSRGVHPGYTSAKSKTFEMNMRTANYVILTTKDFLIEADSLIKSFDQSDLGSAEVSAKLTSTENNGAVLELYLSIKPESLSKEIMIEADDYEEGIPTKLGTSVRLWVGDRNDIGRNGPITAKIDCGLKSLF